MRLYYVKVHTDTTALDLQWRPARQQMLFAACELAFYSHSLILMRRLQLRFDFDSTAVRLLIKGH